MSRRDQNQRPNDQGYEAFSQPGLTRGLAPTTNREGFVFRASGVNLNNTESLLLSDSKTYPVGMHLYPTPDLGAFRGVPSRDSKQGVTQRDIQAQEDMEAYSANQMVSSRGLVPNYDTYGVS